MSTKKAKVFEALFSCNNIKLPKAVQRKSSLEKKNSGLTIDVFNQTSTFGTLYIGQGGFIWRSKNYPKGKRLNWAEVASMLDRRLENRAA